MNPLSTTLFYHNVHIVNNYTCILFIFFGSFSEKKICVLRSTIRLRTLFVSVDGTIALQTDHMPSQTTPAITFSLYKEIAPKDLMPPLHYYGVTVDNKVWVGMKQGNRWLYCCFASSPFQLDCSIDDIRRCT